MPLKLGEANHVSLDTLTHVPSLSLSLKKVIACVVMCHEIGVTHAK